MELSEILAGASAPEPTPASTVETPPPAPQETAPTTTVEQPAERPRDERGRWVKPDAPEAETPPAIEEKPQPMVPRAALMDERRKRQELEARLHANEPPPPEVKDEDYWQAPVEATRKLVDHQGQLLQRQLLNMKFELAEDMTRQLHPDYDEVREQFIEKVGTNDPVAVAIAQQMVSKANPAKFVYDEMSRIAKLTPDYEARIRAEERAKVLAEVGQMQKRVAPDVPRSLNSEPSAPSPATPGAFTPTPLGNLLPNQF
jgi:hypothetical protein